MKTDAEIRQEGMRALIQAMELLEAERFVASLSRERFDYTEWRRTGLPRLTIDALSRQAALLPGRRPPLRHPALPLGRASSRLRFMPYVQWLRMAWGCWRERAGEGSATRRPGAARRR